MIRTSPHPFSPISPRLLVAAIGLLTAQAFAAETTSAAPAPAAQEATVVTVTPEGLPQTWLQGEPVKAFEPGKLYLFEFWATWCGPCIQAMPHMQELHEKFHDRKDFRIIGVNVMDGTAPEKLLPFLKAKKLNITYTMAADGKDGPLQNKWLEPLGVNGIPHAFAIRDGKILWRGHPGNLEPELIEAMLKPDYSPLKAPKTKQQRSASIRPLFGEVSKAAKSGDLAGMEKHIREIIAAGEESDVTYACDVAFRAALLAEKQDLAHEILRRSPGLNPKSRKLLLRSGHLALTTERLDTKDAAFAQECADKALAMNPEDIAAMELKAGALFALGKKDEAVSLQEKALHSTKLHRRIEALRAELAGKTSK